MSIDLERALTDMARSVHDDGVTERMNGQVRQMVGRIRRRRVARYSANGIVGVAAAGAAVVGGLHLADRYPAPAPPATQEPNPDPSATTGLACGDQAPDVPSLADGTALYLEGAVQEPALVDSDLTVGLRLINESGSDMAWGADPVLRLAVVQDGVVVSTGTVEGLPDGVPAQDSWMGLDEVPLAACGGNTPLSPGDYEVVVGGSFGDVTLPDPVEILAGPWPFTLLSPADEASAAEAEMQAIIAASAELSAQYPFGTCGTAVPATASDLLTIDMELASTSYAAGDLMEGTAAVTARDRLTVLGNSPVTAAHVVLTRDGVVVGRGDYDPGDIALNTFTTDKPYPLPALGNALLCSPPDTEPSGLDLPSGEYQAYATLEVALKEIQYPDGNAESRSDLVVIHSDPVDITIN